MKKRVRIKDVAEKAGVSTGTVDRVIHNRGHVNIEVKKRVQEVMDELGFKRNMIASALASNKVLKIGVLLPPPETDHYWARPYAGILKAQQFVQHYGMEIDLHHFEALNPSSFSKAAKKMIQKKPNAVLFPPLFLKEGNWLLKQCQQKGIPNVMINSNIENSNSLCYIGQDSYQSGVLGGRLLSFGVKKGDTVLILSLTKGATNAIHLVEKVQGFKDYFSNNGLSTIQILVEEFEAFNEPRKLKNYLKKLREKHPKLKGIFFTNSRAHYAMDCLDDAFLKKTVIVGFDMIAPNIQHLRDNKIDYLINQNPFEQGRLGITNLYQHFLLKQAVSPIQHLPLDIVVKENVQYYLDREQQVVLG